MLYKCFDDKLNQQATRSTAQASHSLQQQQIVQVNYCCDALVSIVRATMSIEPMEDGEIEEGELSAGEAPPEQVR